jgi:hypothetical protein
VDVARQDPEAPVAKRRSPTSAPAPGGRAARAGRPLRRTRRPAARPAAPGPSGGVAEQPPLQAPLRPAWARPRPAPRRSCGPAPSCRPRGTAPARRCCCRRPAPVTRRVTVPRRRR